MLSCAADILTHRSGLCRESLDMLEYGFANGEGPESFARLVRVLNTRRYDRIRYEYFRAAQHRGIWAENLVPFPPYEDAGKMVVPLPSANYCRDVLLDSVHAMRPELDQAVSLLSAKILAGDASFKVSTDRYYAIKLFKTVQSLATSNGR